MTTPQEQVRGLATFPVEEQAREAAEFHRWWPCHHRVRITQVVNDQVVVSCSQCWADMTGWRLLTEPAGRP